MTADDRVVQELVEELTGPKVRDQRIILEARKVLLNIAATTIGAVGGGELHGALDAAPPGGSAVLGTSVRTELLRSALLNGMLAHYEDFDDTHATLRVHGGAPAVAAAVAVTSERPVSGEHLLAAIAAGVEVQYRFAACLMPEHHPRGWHPTGTLGVLGAAVTAALLRSASPEQVYASLELAAGMTVGVREVFGTQGKPYQVGRAAANGVLAAQLAMAGRRGAGTGITGEDGYLHSLSGVVRTEPLLGRPPEDWELLRNAYKPYPCGKVVHAPIDAGIELRTRTQGEAVDDIELRCNPAALDVAGVERPRDELEAKFSVAYGFAAGFVHGRVSQQHFKARAIANADVAAVMDRLRVHADDDIPNLGSALARARLSSGRDVEVRISAPRGGLEKPLSYADLQTKARGLVQPFDPDMADRLEECLDALPDGANSSAFLEATSPTSDVDALGGGSRPTGAVSALSPAQGTVKGDSLGLTSRVVALVHAGTPPASAIAAASEWLTTARDVLGTTANTIAAWPDFSGAFNGPDGSAEMRALRVGAALGRAAPNSVPRLALPVIAAVLASGPSDSEAEAHAVALGTEVGARILQLITRARADHGWDVAGCLGPLAAAAALSRLAGDSSRTPSLLTVAGTQVGGLGTRSRHSLLDVNVAVAAATASAAEELTRAGMQPSVDIIDGRRGLMAVLRASIEQPVDTDDLSDEWLLIKETRREHAIPSTRPS